MRFLALGLAALSSVDFSSAKVTKSDLSAYGVENADDLPEAVLESIIIQIEKDQHSKTVVPEPKIRIPKLPGKKKEGKYGRVRKNRRKKNGSEVGQKPQMKGENEEERLGKISQPVATENNQVTTGNLRLPSKALIGFLVAITAVAAAYMRSPDETEEFLRYYIAEISKGVDWANVNYFTPGYHMANDQLKGWHFGKYMGMLQARFLSEGNGRTWAEFVDQHLKSEEMSKTFGNMFDGERWSQYWKSFGSS